MAEITHQALVDNMLELLKTFNDEGVELNPQTVHNEVLAADDGATASTSSIKLYSGAVQWIIWRNSGKKVKLPGGWVNNTVDELAESLILKISNQ